MTVRPPLLIPTPVERAAGRFMRAPDHDEAKDAVDNDDDTDEDDDQSGQSDDAADGDDQEGDTDDAETSDDDDGDGKPKNRRNGYEKRIAKLTRRAKEAERERDQLKAVKGDAPTTEKKQPSSDGKPKLDDFDTYEDWIEALTEYKADQKVNASKEASSREKAETEFLSRFKAGRAKFKDWDDVVTDDVQISTSMQSAIKESDMPADILYYLGENPEEAERIVELSAGKQALAIGKIEAKLEKSGKDSGKQVERRQSSAPEPIKPNNGAGKKLTKSYEDMSFGEFAAQRARETRGGNRQRII